MSYEVKVDGRKAVSRQQIGTTCEQCGTSYFAIEIDVRGIARTDVCGCEVEVVDVEEDLDAVDRGDGPITDGGRAPIPTPESRQRLLDLVADISHDSVDAGVDPEEAAKALREVSRGIEQRADRYIETDGGRWVYAHEALRRAEEVENR